MNSTRNPYRLAEKHDITVIEARKMLQDNPSPLEGWGKPSLQHHIISRRHIAGDWPLLDREVLSHHRQLHDQGKVTMCQGRDGDFVIQYAVPSVTVIKRMAYFSALIC